jgi:hypothetical protein
MQTKPEAKSSSARKAIVLLAALAIASFSGFVVLGVLYFGQQPASAEPAIPAGVALKSWFDNGAGGQHLLRVFRGEAPAAGVRVTGTVMTDTDCDPDALGLSHCHNIIDLGNGRRIEVENTHNMPVHPCLSPGQRLTVIRLNADWLVASEGQPARAY